MSGEAPRPAAAGFAWALTAVAIWAAWFAATAHGVRGSMAAVDVTLIRVVVPTLLLAPLLWRGRDTLKRLHWWQVAGISLYGVPFVLCLSTGLTLAPISHAVALVPGLMPVFMGMLGALLLGERLTARRLAGFALMLLSASLIATEAGVFSGTFTTEARGHLFFLAAGLAWALFTLTTRHAGLDAFVSTGLVGLLSTMLLLPPYLLLGLGRLADAPTAEIGFQIVAQGLLAGLVAIYAYARAIRTLGASSAAAAAALVPGSAALIAWATLAERPTALEATAMVVVAIGVWLASGVRLRLPSGVRTDGRRSGRRAA